MYSLLYCIHRILITYLVHISYSYPRHLLEAALVAHWRQFTGGIVTTGTDATVLTTGCPVFPTSSIFPYLEQVKSLDFACNQSYRSSCNTKIPLTVPCTVTARQRLGSFVSIVIFTFKLVSLPPCMELRSSPIKTGGLVDISPVQQAVDCACELHFSTFVRD